MSLCGPDGGISGAQNDRIVPRPLLEGGHEAWNLIMRLRSRAWIKAGLNPETIPTRAQVVQLAEDQLDRLRSDIESGMTTHDNWTELQFQHSEALPDLGKPSGVNYSFSPNLNWQDWDAIFDTV